MEGFLTTVVILLSGLAFLLGIFLLAWNFMVSFYIGFLNQYLLLLPLTRKQKNILSQHCAFYRMLPARKKRKFERRLRQFIYLKEFIPRGGLPAVSMQMKVLISASAIQITFGWPRIYLKHFDKILIYPDSYYSNITRKYHKGEVNRKGLIVLSWNNFVEGNRWPNDGVNLGLHEMAHALKIENGIYNGNYKFMSTRYWKDFYKIAETEIAQIKQAQTSFFKSHAGSNVHEFFAAVIEQFFERPLALQSYNRKLYELTCRLLNQNPLLLAEQTTSYRPH